jgi:hypothetical protein
MIWLAFVIWLICGFVAAGYENGHSREKYPIMYNKYYPEKFAKFAWDQRVYMFICTLFGPVALLSLPSWEAWTLRVVPLTDEELLKCYMGLGYTQVTCQKLIDMHKSGAVGDEVWKRTKSAL